MCVYVGPARLGTLLVGGAPSLVHAQKRTAELYDVPIWVLSRLLLLGQVAVVRTSLPSRPNQAANGSDDVFGSFEQGGNVFAKTAVTLDRRRGRDRIEVEHHLSFNDAVYDYPLSD